MVSGVIDRFNVHSVVMLTYLQPNDVVRRPDRNREEPESGGFNSILQKQYQKVRAIPEKATKDR